MPPKLSIPLSHASTHAAGGGDQVAISPSQTRMHDWLPADYGLLAWTTEPVFDITQTVAHPAAGRLYLARIKIPEAMTPARLWYYCSAGGSGITTFTVGLYSTAGSLLGHAAVTVTTGAIGTALKNWTLTADAGLALTAGSSVFAAMLPDHLTGTLPQFYGITSGAAAFANLNISGANARWAQSNESGLDTMPSSIATASVGNVSAQIWIGLST